MSTTAPAPPASIRRNRADYVEYWLVAFVIALALCMGTRAAIHMFG